eukprot:1137610-Pelagomonas_calceolata.AAC.2
MHAEVLAPCAPAPARALGPRDSTQLSKSALPCGQSSCVQTYQSTGHRPFNTAELRAALYAKSLT